MRTAILNIMLVVFGFVSHAQLSLQPMIGFQNSQTCIKVNDQKGFSPLHHVYSPQMSLRMDYLFKKGHGPFVGIHTSNTGVNFSFNDPANGINNYYASKADYRVAVAGGYSFITKPIFFNKSKANTTKAKDKETVVQKHVMVKKSCGSYSREIKSYSSRGHCGSKNKTSGQMITKPAEKINRDVMQADKKKNSGWFMQVQPSAGIAFVPGISNGIEKTTVNGTDEYKYTAGDYNTALITGARFIFGKNNNQKFLVNLNYFKGLGNLSTESLIIEEGGKTTATHLRSSVSGWSLGVGVPIQLTKRKVQKAKITEQKMMYKKQCERYYRPGCSKKS